MNTHGKYLLDTCTCIALIKGKHGVAEHVREVGVDECKISDITLDVVTVMNLFEQYPITHLRKYGEIRWMLEKRGKKIGDMDMFIAATALEEDLIVVTGNVKHFSHIDGLKIENWME